MQGRKPADRRVRVERPHSPYFRYTGPGQLVAKPAANLALTPTGRFMNRVRAVVFGRARDYSDADHAALDRMLVEVIGGEFEAPGLPVVTGLDFGHTDPQWLLPLGVRAELDLETRSLRLVEPWLE